MKRHSWIMYDKLSWAWWTWERLRVCVVKLIARNSNKLKSHFTLHHISKFCTSSFTKISRHVTFNRVECIDFGSVITFAVEVWSWTLFQIKDPLAFGSSVCVSTNQNIVLHNHRARCLVVLFCCAMIWFMEPQIEHQTSMDLSSGITSKTKLLQKNWAHLQNLCIKVDQIAYAKSLEIFVRQEQRNFDMWELHFLANALLKRKM